MEKIHVRMALGVLWNGEQVFIRPDGRQVVLRRGAMIAVPENAERDLTLARVSNDKRSLREERARTPRETRILRTPWGIRSIPTPPSPPVDVMALAKDAFAPTSRAPNTTTQVSPEVERYRSAGTFNRSKAESAPKMEPGHKTNIGAGTKKGPGGSRSKATTNPKKAEKLARKLKQRKR